MQAISWELSGDKRKETNGSSLTANSIVVARLSHFIRTFESGKRTTFRIFFGTSHIISYDVHLTWQTRSLIVTARIRRMGEGNIFTLCVSPHLDRGGGTLSQVWVGGLGYPILGLARGGTSARSRMGYPPGPEMGYPPRHGMGYLPRPGMGYPPRPGTGYPPRPGTGYHPPPPDLRWVPPRTDQHSEHLLHGGRYTSYIHAGGLTCCFVVVRYLKTDHH